MTKKIDLYKDNIGFIEVINSMGDDLTSLNCARISFDKKAEYEEGGLNNKDSKLLKYLLTNGHWSVFDQAFVSFRIKVPMFIRAQHFRHQSWKFNEVSRRYTVLDEQEFYTPAQFRKQSETNRQASVDDFVDNPDVKMYSHALQLAYIQYRRLLEIGVCREQARGVLPQATYTEYIATASLRSIIHFLKARLDSHAQYEIRVLAEAMQELVLPNFPETFKILHEIKR